MSEPNQPASEDVLVVDPETQARALVRRALVRARAPLGAPRVVEAPTLRDAERAVERAERLDLVVLELGLPDGWAHELIGRSRARFPWVRSVVHSQFDDDANVLRAFGLGAHGYLLKGHTEEELAALLGEAGGQPPVSPNLARRLLETFRQRVPEPNLPVTPKELAVVQLLARGLTNAEAARCLGVSAHTVSSHVKSIYRKLDISTRAEMTSLAARHGWSGTLSI
ncbi:MAG TPA: response regulator transcription factor [Polyangiaceae bacterium]|nr:response regulator transcription factor [Polyangiaceae bacterium]